MAASDVAEQKMEGNSTKAFKNFSKMFM
jgi:hypothetical protein